jgi:hypothetical protein
LCNAKHVFIGASSFEAVNGEENETAVAHGVAVGAVYSVDARGERKVLFGA